MPRDVDHGPREQLANGGFVLLIGDSTAGKTRAAFEAMTATLAGHLLICPAGVDAVAIALTRTAQERQCGLWLDDLERFLGTGGLSVEACQILTDNGKVFTNRFGPGPGPVKFDQIC